MTEERLQKIIDEISDNGTRIMRPNMVMKAMKQAVNEALDEAHTEGLREQLESEIEFRKHWQGQAQRYHKYHKELNAALERAYIDFTSSRWTEKLIK